MARARLVAKSLSTSARFARVQAVAGPLSDFAQLLFPLLVTHADDWGRLPGDPFTVKHTVVPTSRHAEADVSAALAALALVQLIQWYEVKGQKYIQIEQFETHQSGLHKRRASGIPPPPPGNSRKFPEVPGVPGISGSRARAESESESESECTYRKNAAARPTPPVEKSRPRPKVSTLAAMIRQDLLPLAFIDEGELVEAAKQRAARLHLTYNASAIRRAIASARAQVSHEALDRTEVAHVTTERLLATDGLRADRHALPADVAERLQRLKADLGRPAAAVHKGRRARRRPRSA